MASFNDRLLSLRKQRDLTQSDLANKIGLNKQTISQYERGVRRPDLETLMLLCDFFNVSTDFMLGETDFTMRIVNIDDLAALDAMITKEEADMIIAYRNAPAGRQDAVRALLNIEGR